MLEHDFEPVEGLPERPPEGETVLWQGSPDWRALVRHAFHIRAIALYFAVLAAWRGGDLLSRGEPLADAITGAAVLVILGAVVLGLLALFAYGTARTSLYTITNRRLVIRTGIAMPMAVNLPFDTIATAGLKLHADGSGEIGLHLVARAKVAWLAVWPHARPWRFARVEPTLRGLAAPAEVARILGQALAASAGGPVAQPAVAVPVSGATGSGGPISGGPVSGVRVADAAFERAPAAIGQRQAAAA